ncbi:hypothetical protein NL108_008273 [Boleophthalmus pectinirostris]|nr:hypothetical protein NL108_008273 [Boleophthalmus pectinirostris]
MGYYTLSATSQSPSTVNNRVSEVGAEEHKSFLQLLKKNPHPAPRTERRDWSPADRPHKGSSPTDGPQGPHGQTAGAPESGFYSKAKGPFVASVTRQSQCQSAHDSRPQTRAEEPCSPSAFEKILGKLVLHHYLCINSEKQFEEEMEK